MLLQVHTGFSTVECALHFVVLPYGALSLRPLITLVCRGSRSLDVRFLQRPESGDAMRMRAQEGARAEPRGEVSSRKTITEPSRERDYK